MNNLQCKNLLDFQWYKNTFLIRIYAKLGRNQAYWKKKFLDGLSKSLRDLVRDELRNQYEGVVA